MAKQYEHLTRASKAHLTDMYVILIGYMLPHRGRYRLLYGQGVGNPFPQLCHNTRFTLDSRYIVIKNAFSKEQVEEWTSNVWVRLGMDPNDKSTWTNEKVHMPWHCREPVQTFAPKVK